MLEQTGDFLHSPTAGRHGRATFGVTLQTWLSEMTTGSPAWTNAN